MDGKTKSTELMPPFPGGEGARAKGKVGTGSAAMLPPRRINKVGRLLLLVVVFVLVFISVTGSGLLIYNVVKARRGEITSLPTPTPTATADVPASTETFETLMAGAKTNFQQNRFNEALEMLDRASKLDATKAETSKLRGDVLVAATRYQESIDSYKEALRLDKNDIETYKKLGTSYEQLGKDDEAIDTYGAALAIKDDEQALRLQMARALVRRGRLDEARKSLDQVAASPDAQLVADAKQEIAKLKDGQLIAANKTPKPMPTPTATPVLTGPPPNVSVTPTPEPTPTPTTEPVKPEVKPEPTISAEEHMQRGLKLKNSGDLGGALREFQRALKQQPGKLDAYYLIGLIYEQMNDFDSALNAFERCQSGPYAGVSRNHIELIKKKRKK